MVKSIAITTARMAYIIALLMTLCLLSTSGGSSSQNIGPINNSTTSELTIGLTNNAYPSNDTNISLLLSSTAKAINDSKKYQVVNSPQHGTISNTEPIVLYSPEKDYIGNDTFSLLAKGEEGMRIITVEINVIQVIPHLRLRIIRPEYGDVFVNAPANIELIAVTDSSNNENSITNVEFFEGLNDIGPADNVSSSVPDDSASVWKKTWKNVGVGTYSLTAKATDCKSQIEVSSPVKITVGPKNDPPRIVMTSPYDGQIFTSPATIPITVEAWDNDDNVSKVEIFEGSNKLGERSCVEGKDCAYKLIWSNADSGLYALKAVAVDDRGAVGTSYPMTVIVAPNSKD